jgi:NAD+ synthase (glutamine-hydrolysing)
MVFSMCRLVIDALKEGNAQVEADVRRLAVYSQELPATPQELCKNLFHTVYMGMRTQSSKETRSRAKELSQAIGSFHVDMDIDDVFQ